MARRCEFYIFRARKKSFLWREDIHSIIIDLMMKTLKHTLILSMLCLLVHPLLNRQALPAIKLCLNTSKGPVSFGAIGRLLEAEKNRLMLIKILSSFKQSTIKSWGLLPILWLLNILLAMFHSLRQQLSYWAHTNDNFIIGGDWIIEY